MVELQSAMQKRDPFLAQHHMPNASRCRCPSVPFGAVPNKVFKMSNWVKQQIFPSILMPVKPHICPNDFHLPYGVTFLLFSSPAKSMVEVKYLNIEPWPYDTTYIYIYIYIIFVYNICIYIHYIYILCNISRIYNYIHICEMCSIISIRI